MFPADEILGLADDTERWAIAVGTEGSAKGCRAGAESSAPCDARADEEAEGEGAALGRLWALRRVCAPGAGVPDMIMPPSRNALIKTTINAS